MWSRPSSVRSASVHSISHSISSLHSYDSERSSDSEAFNDFNDRTGRQLWHPQDGLARKPQQESPKIAEIYSRPLITTVRLNQEGNHIHSPPESETQSQATTLDVEEDYEQPEKTPTLLPPTKYVESQEEVHPQIEQYEVPEYREPEPVRIPGPLEQQLSALMSKIIYMERENPTISVSPEEYQAMQDRIMSLEAEKAAMAARYEALFALRDEDVANLIKVRVLLAEERWEHANIRKLRDDDLGNVISLRNRLAEATRKIETLEKTGGRMTPPRRPRSIVSIEGRNAIVRESMERRNTLERRDTLEQKNTTDLFQAARTAALEQRALELEKANEDLQRQMAAMKLEGPSPEVEQRWQDRVSELESQLKQKEDELSRASQIQHPQQPAQPQPQLSNTTDPMTWNRIEGMLDENARYREKMAQKMQQLRSEKEILQRELHQKEDENADLEAKVEKLQRYSNAGLLQKILR
ncbi:conserved hypothetical protein [Paecilomyces variotii No. 5]|uniref:Uncharacterized protein n=1 Tax=Byssochlamys spectabilis (strain No. 5 / NBRC 109023) TaxID=1356009 RepID=V5HUC1_BYSSN|nr:conserved hypothetical protein [Paecilomyces variotii No. 5]